MKIFRMMVRSAGPMVAAVAAVGVLSAAMNTGLIAVIHRSLVETADPISALLWAFVGLGIGRVLTTYMAGMMVSSFAQQSLTKMRRGLTRKLLAVPYQRLEQMGRAPLYTALTADVSSVNGALLAAPGGLVNLAVLTGGSLYLLYLSWHAFFGLVVFGLLGASVYHSVSKGAQPHLNRARDEHEALYQHFHALTVGTKELKMHAPRRRAFLDKGVSNTTEALMQHMIAWQSRNLLAQVVTNVLILAVLGAMLYAMPAMGDMAADTASGYVLTALFLMAPLSAIVRTLPMFASATVALERVEALGVQLDDVAVESQTAATPRTHFERIELDQITHRFSDGPFVLGPLSLTLVPGEVLFVTGGNGSGKSTLAKVLLGLYTPAEGSVRLDGEPVTDSTRDTYRQLFSVVFSDFHLFDSFLGLEPEGLDARADALLEVLGLASEVQMDEGKLSRLNLSQGQRKRLALLTAYLEDRPVYVFDEWAADQEPDFKRIFYHELIPALKAKGKAVVVITHDDLYFDAADRRIELDAGRIREP